MKYSEQHTVNYYECDENRHLRLPAMINLMMSVSENQLADSSGSTEELTRRGLGWVVTQYHLDVNRWPEPGEVITLTTEPKLKILIYM